MIIALMKPWSVWSSTLTKHARENGAIATFSWEAGMWREYKFGGMVGISDVRMKWLISVGYAKEIVKT